MIAERDKRPGRGCLTVILLRLIILIRLLANLEDEVMRWRHGTAARQYLASEQGAIVRDWGGRVPIVLAYPNSYAVGMSSLAMHGLYRWFNALPGVVCERAFAWYDRPEGADEPLLTLESQRPVAEAAALALSVSFEMDYFHVIQMLRRAQVPERAEQREQGDPFVILGGPAVSANPEPLAPLADAIVIGEAEELLEPLVEILREGWAGARHEVLAALARLPGLYVPALYTGKPVQRQYVADLDAWPTHSSLLTPRAEFGDMHLIELSRGCGRGCRFCLAGYWYRPRRERSIENVLAQARAGLANGIKKMGLVAAAVSDYQAIDELVPALRQMGADISVSSLRVKPLSTTLLRALADSGSLSVTLAPEAGSERLRRVIHKGIEEADVLAATEIAARYGFHSLKLYFMIGLPGETEQDIEELLHLVQEVQHLFAREVVVNVTPFVPKAHTPFQHVALATNEVIEVRLARLRVGTAAMGTPLRAETGEATRVQAILARGDRRLGEALLALRRPVPARFERALMSQGLDPLDYLGELAPQGPFPWDVVDDRIPATLLQAEWQRAQADLACQTCRQET
jgi:radical SAM superfamily enzyme YgiQ (UPF0313 family)